MNRSISKRLLSYGPGFEMGAFQEGSNDLYTLLGTLDDFQLRVGAWPEEEGGNRREEKYHPFWAEQVTWSLTMAAAKANSSCMLDMVFRVRENRQAAKRRARMISEEEKRGGEESHLACKCQGYQ